MPPDIALSTIEDLRAAAREAASRGDASLAYSFLSQALTLLGNAYRDGARIDDTGLKSLAARDLLARGDAPGAAVTLGRVLDERLASYTAKGGPIVAPPPNPICSNCGAATIAGAKFCGACGSTISTGESGGAVNG